MRKSAWVFMIIFAILTLNSLQIVYAEENTLNLETVINKSLQNSSALKNQQNRLNNLQENYQMAEKGSLLAQSRVEADEHYRELVSRKDLTLKEKAEQEAYLQMFSAKLTDEERVYYKKLKEMTIPNIEYGINVTTLQKKATQNGIMGGASELYGNLIKVNNGIEVKKSLVEDLEKNYSNVQSLLRYGYVASTKVHLVELTLEENKLELEQLAKQKELLIDNLNKLMGEDVSKRYSKYEAINMEPVEHKSLNEYLNAAIEKRIEIVSSEKAYALKQKEYNIIAEVYLDDNNLNKINSKYDLANSRKQRDDYKTEVEKGIKNSYKLFQNKIADYENSISKYNIQKSNYEDDKNKYQLGLLTDTNLLDTSLYVKNAELQMNNARIDVWIYQTKMKYASSEGPAFSIAIQ